MLRTYISENQLDWDQYVSACTFMYNTSHDLQRQTLSFDESQLYLQNLVASLHAAWRAAARFNATRREGYKRQYDRTHLAPLSIKVGDLVYLRNFAPSRVISVPKKFHMNQVKLCNLLSGPVFTTPWLPEVEDLALSVVEATYQPIDGYNHTVNPTVLCFRLRMDNDPSSSPPDRGPDQVSRYTAESSRDTAPFRNSSGPSLTESGADSSQVSVGMYLEMSVESSPHDPEPMDTTPVSSDISGPDHQQDETLSGADTGPAHSETSHAASTLAPTQEISSAPLSPFSGRSSSAHSSSASSVTKPVAGLTTSMEQLAVTLSAPSEHQSSSKPPMKSARSSSGHRKPSSEATSSSAGLGASRGIPRGTTRGLARSASRASTSRSAAAQPAAGRPSSSRSHPAPSRARSASVSGAVQARGGRRSRPRPLRRFYHRLTPASSLVRHPRVTLITWMLIIHGRSISTLAPFTCSEKLYRV
ncbi:unnamed protein product [Haemonchus placei]|uniref:Reverse transcriptase n=1 Tax=Haemonchus placei TaxID=6290 RepID=A0A0N4X9H1_HAEPC|nr:unnamed protein product [Haemonchus placei]